MIWQVGEAGTNQAKERISGEMLASLRGNDRHGNPRLENLKSFQGEGYCRIDVYEKATGISRWLLGFVALRELLLTLLHHTTEVHPCPFSLLEALLEEPFPHTPQEMLQLEQRLSTAAAQTADQIVLAQLTRAHEAEAFVTQAIAQARAQSPVPLVHKGFR